MKAIEIVTLENLTKKLLKMNDDNFKVAMFFNSYFNSLRGLIIDNLISSEHRDEDVGIITHLGLLITKINLIQEKRDEG